MSCVYIYIYIYISLMLTSSQLSYTDLCYPPSDLPPNALN